MRFSIPKLAGTVVLTAVATLLLVNLFSDGEKHITRRVEHQYDVNRQCVSSVGVSAGALFTDQLAQARSNTLSSFI